MHPGIDRSEDVDIRVTDKIAVFDRDTEETRCFDRSRWIGLLFDTLASPEHRIPSPVTEKSIDTH